MERPTRWTYGWVYYLTAGILYGAAVLRSVLTYQNSPILNLVLTLLSAALLLFFAENFLTSKWPAIFYPYLVLQGTVITLLLYMPDQPDYFAMFFAILAMQVMQQLEPIRGVLWIAMFIPLTFAPILWSYGLSKAIAFTLVYTAVNAFMAAYSLATRRAQEERSNTTDLAMELERTNAKLQSYTDQLERLAISTERNRLARELHDSVTQTIFSMSLTTQSALLLMEEDRNQVADQLNRLYQLVRSATAEMQTLISELRPEGIAEGDLAEAIRHHLTDGHLPEDLLIDLQIEGDLFLKEEEAKSLFRIIQEALNNIVKHAEADWAQIRLHLTDPAWIEVRDQGRGFDLAQAPDKKGIGLSSMDERAREIGWALRVMSTPGEGTRIRVEKPSEERRT